MEQKEIVKKYLVALAMIVAAAVIITLAVNYYQSIWGNRANDEEFLSNQKVTETVKSSELPKKFPSDIPIETGVEIIKNENSVDPDGTTHATRTFVSSKTLDENHSIYSKYLNDNGLVIENSVNQPENKVMFASKGQQNIQIAITLLKETKTNTVTISISE